MTNDLTADDVRRLLKLESYGTRAFVRITVVSKQRIALGGLLAPFVDARPAGSAPAQAFVTNVPTRLTVNGSDGR